MITPIQPRFPQDVARHYDTLDLFYRDTWGRHLHHGWWETGRESPEEAAALLTHAVAERLALPGDGARVVDIGCGYGETSWYLADHFGTRVTGYTLSEAQRGEAIDRGPSSPETPLPEFILGDWLDNDLPGASIDAALSIECVSHVADKQRFFSEIARVLKPGGRLVLCAWLAKEGATPWQRRHLLEPICDEGRLAGLATMAEYRSLIAHAGLSLLEADDIGPQVAKTWSVIARRLALKVLTDRRYTRFLFDSLATDRVFAFTVPRLLLAYRVRAMGYLLLVAEKS